MSSFQLLPFGAASGSGLLALALLWGMPQLRQGCPPLKLRATLAMEAAFLLFFCLGLAVRLQEPDLLGLEKFTDMSFVAAAMRADYMPPSDAWYAGHSINYYYLGHAMVAAWANLVGVSAAHGYQLAMATLFALSALGAAWLTAQIAWPWGRRMALILGALTAVLTVYGGNGHSILYQIFRPLMPAQRPFFHYPDSTRFIGFDPDVPNKAFTEFTAYGFRAGDLHAHVLATPLVLLGWGVILSILQGAMASGRVAPLQAVFLGWLIGLAYGVNAWDVPILGLGALVVALLLLALPAPLTRGQRLDHLGASAILTLAVALAVALPFAAGFHAFAEGLRWVGERTPLWQLLILWCHVLPGLLLIALLPLARVRLPLLAPLIAFGVTGGLLVILPEVLYVKDIYGSDHARANTMFKLTFRAQTLLVLVAVAAIAPAFAQRGRRWTIGAFLALAPLVASLAYLPHVYAPLSSIRALEGLEFLGQERALVAAADDLRLGKGEAIVEASSDAFTAGARVSALTGQPAVIGWTGHEWLWRGEAEGPYRRLADVDAFYTTPDAALRCAIIRRYGIAYVILGRQERQRYPALAESELRRISELHFDSEGGAILRIPPHLCPRSRLQPQAEPP